MFLSAYKRTDPRSLIIFFILLPHQLPSYFSALLTPNPSEDLSVFIVCKRPLLLLCPPARHGNPRCKCITERLSRPAGPSCGATCWPPSPQSWGSEYCPVSANSLHAHNPFMDILSFHRETSHPVTSPSFQMHLPLLTGLWLLTMCPHG